MPSSPRYTYKAHSPFFISLLLFPMLQGPKLEVFAKKSRFLLFLYISIAFLNNRAGLGWGVAHSIFGRISFGRSVNLVSYLYDRMKGHMQQPRRLDQIYCAPFSLPAHPLHPANHGPIGRPSGISRTKEKSREQK